MDTNLEDLNNKVNKTEDSKTVERSLFFAGFWMRFWAYLLDLIVIGSINRILIYPLFRGLNLPIVDHHMFSFITISTTITFYLYFILMTKYFSQTLGKMVFGLRVIDLNDKPLTWSTIIFREFIGRFISKFTVVGYIIVGFLPKKQGLHDIFSDTTVVHER
ncbi:RDD family protein [Bacillus timonensis]|nr:RDD family protein [Bacillus timonensis]